MNSTSKTHRIDLRPAYRYDTAKGRGVGIGKDIMSYDGRDIGTTDQSIHAAARYLLKHGLAAPSDRIVTYRGDTPCLMNSVGSAAHLSVHDDDRRGLYAAPYKPYAPTTAPAPMLPETAGLAAA